MRGEERPEAEKEARSAQDGLEIEKNVAWNIMLSEPMMRNYHSILSLRNVPAAEKIRPASVAIVYAPLDPPPDVPNFSASTKRSRIGRTF